MPLTRAIHLFGSPDTRVVNYHVLSWRYAQLLARLLDQ
jgi:hypothetical protein